MIRVIVPLVVASGLAASPVRAQSAGVSRDGLSGSTLALHLMVDLLAGMVVVGHATMYGNMLLAGASPGETLASGMGAWPTVTLTALAGSAALAAGAVGLAGGDDDARSISIISTTIGSLALACAGVDLVLTLVSAEPSVVAPMAFADGHRFFAGVTARF